MAEIDAFGRIKLTTIQEERARTLNRLLIQAKHLGNEDSDDLLSQASQIVASFEKEGSDVRGMQMMLVLYDSVIDGIRAGLPNGEIAKIYTDLGFNPPENLLSQQKK